jgi:uncharacterized membrane protein (UPF0127 family)
MQTQTLRRLDGTIVCERCTVADNPLRRMKGLLGRDGLESGEGLLLRPASAVHTYFMRFPIDVVFLDADGVVVRVAADVRPWRAARYGGASDVLELAAGTSGRVGVREGVRLIAAPESGS